jgi:hypothetical protein
VAGQDGGDRAVPIEPMKISTASTGAISACTGNSSQVGQPVEKIAWKNAAGTRAATAPATANPMSRSRPTMPHSIR